jgi:hypothetical protein
LPDSSEATFLERGRSLHINSGSNCFNPGEKAKQNISYYYPTVIVLTEKINGRVEITVKDNGNGFTEAIK